MIIWLYKYQKESSNVQYIYIQYNKNAEYIADRNEECSQDYSNKKKTDWLFKTKKVKKNLLTIRSNLQYNIFAKSS